MASTRRLAAILAADMVGYSRLMGLDETGTVQALREHRAAGDPIIAEHGGRIVKTSGDGVLIEFGSVVGAVECALEWPIGVHLGDVLIEGGSATASTSPSGLRASPSPVGSASPKTHSARCAARSRPSLPISASRA